MEEDKKSVEKTLKMFDIKNEDAVEEAVFEEDDIDWESEHPLFMTKLPDNPDENEGLVALKAMKYGEETPEGLAESYKEKGNECFRSGRKYLKVAIQWYTKAIMENITDKEKVSVYFSNRGAANLELSNFKSTVEDCKIAIQLNPNNVKAYFRAAKACGELEKFDEAYSIIDDGLQKSSGHKDLLILRKDIEKKALEARKIREERERKMKAIEHEKNIAMKAKGDWINALSSRNIALGRFLYPIMEEYLHGHKVKPYISEDKNETHWPVLFMYDEYKQVDFIQDFNENSTIGEHISLMFNGDYFCEWDTERKYVADKLEAYVILNHVTPYIEKSKRERPRKIRIKHSTPLKKILEHPEYVVPGYPVIYLVVSGSPFKEEFLKRPIDGGDEFLY